MKKKIIAIILLVLALALIGTGIYFGLSVSKGKNPVEKKPAADETEAEITDIFTVHTVDELKAQSEKDKLTLSTTDIENRVFAYGYEFCGRVTNVNVYHDKNQKITKMSLDNFPFLTVPNVEVSIPAMGAEVVNQDSGLTAEALKTKCEEAMDVIAKRFKTSVDGNYNVFDSKAGKELDKEKDNVFEKLVNREAYLTFSIKTKDGEIWELFVENQEFYGGILFRLTRNIDTTEINGFWPNIDLSAE